MNVLFTPTHSPTNLQYISFQCDAGVADIQRPVRDTRRGEVPGGGGARVPSRPASGRAGESGRGGTFT